MNFLKKLLMVVVSVALLVVQSDLLAGPTPQAGQGQQQSVTTNNNPQQHSIAGTALKGFFALIFGKIAFDELGNIMLSLAIDPSKCLRNYHGNIYEGTYGSTPTGYFSSGNSPDVYYNPLCFAFDGPHKYFYCSSGSDYCRSIVSIIIASYSMALLLDRAGLVDVSGRLGRLKQAVQGGRLGRLMQAAKTKIFG